MYYKSILLFGITLVHSANYTMIENGHIKRTDELQNREKYTPPLTSMTVTVGNQRIDRQDPELTPFDIAYINASQLVQKHLNKDDGLIISLIGRRLYKNKPGYIYYDLQDERTLIKELLDSSTEYSQNVISHYLIHEITDSYEKTKANKAKERKQKYIVAIIGTGATIIATITSCLVTFFLNK